jgi:hypothetical protein
MVILPNERPAGVSEGQWTKVGCWRAGGHPDLPLTAHLVSRVWRDAP